MAEETHECVICHEDIEDPEEHHRTEHRGRRYSPVWYFYPPGG